MVQAGRADAADVHARALPDRLEALENRDVFSGVVRGCHVYNVRLVNRLRRYLLCSTIVAAFPLHPAAAAGVSEDVPLHGGTAALSRALGIDPVPDRSRFLFEVTRLVYDTPEGRRPAADAFLQALRQSVGRAAGVRLRRSTRDRRSSCRFR